MLSVFFFQNHHSNITVTQSRMSLRMTKPLKAGSGWGEVGGQMAKNL